MLGGERQKACSCHGRVLSQPHLHGPTEFQASVPNSNPTTMASVT